MLLRTIREAAQYGYHVDQGQASASGQGVGPGQHAYGSHRRNAKAQQHAYGSQGALSPGRASPEPPPRHHDGGSEDSCSGAGAGASSSRGGSCSSSQLQLHTMASLLADVFEGCSHSGRFMDSVLVRLGGGHGGHGAQAGSGAGRAGECLGLCDSLGRVPPPLLFIATLDLHDLVSGGLVRAHLTLASCARAQLHAGARGRGGALALRAQPALPGLALALCRRRTSRRARARARARASSECGC